MSKKVSWDDVYRNPMGGKRTPDGANYRNGTELMQQAFKRDRQAQLEAQRFQAIEPELRKSLLEHMVSRTPIRVTRPMSYLTEELNKGGQDEIDKAYYRRPTETTNASFEIVQKAITPGTELTFVRIDSQLGQWIFKSSTGQEIEIYNTPTVHVPYGAGTRVVQNPGFLGLLLATNIYDDVVRSVSDSE